MHQTLFRYSPLAAFKCKNAFQFHSVVSVPVKRKLLIFCAGADHGLMTSNADDGTFASVASSSSFHRESGAPLTYQPVPLSAMSIP